MARQFTVVIERDDEGYLVGSVPDLKGCHTQATSMDELLDRMREAILLCLDVQGEEATAPSTSVVSQQQIYNGLSCPGWYRPSLSKQRAWDFHCLS